MRSLQEAADAADELAAARVPLVRLLVCSVRAAGPFCVFTWNEIVNSAAPVKPVRGRGRGRRSSAPRQAAASESLRSRRQLIVGSVVMRC